MQTVTFNHPFREAASLVDSTIVSTLFHCALAGRGYVLDLTDESFRWQSIEYMRPQQDQASQSGEGSLSNVDLWRRTFRSWHEGAGQSRWDEDDSSPYRFNTSQGVNPWDRWHLSLINDTLIGSAGAASPATVLVADGRLFHQSGQQINVSDDGENWVPLTTLVATPTAPAVTDGTDLYVATDGPFVKKVTSAGVTSNAFTLPGEAEVIGFSKGRLWAGIGTELYWMTPGSPTPTSHVDVEWPGWTFTAICEGNRATYASGYSGDKSQVWAVPLKADGTDLNAGVVACSLPDGELVTALGEYLGYVMLGTSRGVRFSVPNDNADISYGQYIPTPGPVYCFEPQDKFVWFGWSNYDDDFTGLGRVDLSVFTSELTPAYASDLMYLGQGDVVAATTFADRRIFVVDGVGAIGEIDSPVEQGTIALSDVTYGLNDKKIASLVTMTHLPLDGAVSVALSVDGSGAGVIGESSSQGSGGPPSALSFNPITARRLALELTLTVGALDEGPDLTGISLLAHPVPPRGERFTLPILLREQVDVDQKYTAYRPESELQFLRGLVKTGAPVTLQIGDEAFNVFPANYTWVPYRQTQNKAGWSGTCIMELREVTQ